MHYGMSYEQFWFMDPWMAKAYKEKNLLDRKQKNEEMWVNGAYQLTALSVALNNAFNKHKIDYVKEPFNIFPKTEAEIEMDKQKQRQELIEWLSRMTIKEKPQQGVGLNGKP